MSGVKQGLSSPNTVPDVICVSIFEISARFRRALGVIVVGTMSKVSGVLHTSGQCWEIGMVKSSNAHDSRVEETVVDDLTESDRVDFLGFIGELDSEGEK